MLQHGPVQSYGAGVVTKAPYSERMAKLYETTFNSLTDLHVELIELRAKLLGNVIEPPPGPASKQPGEENGMLAEQERLVSIMQLRIQDAVMVVKQIRQEL